MIFHKAILAGLALAVTAPIASAGTNAACISVADHVHTILSSRGSVDAQTLTSLERFKVAQEHTLDGLITQSAAAYGIDEAALSQQSLQERAIMKTQLAKRFGTDTLYRDNIIMLTNCAKTSNPEDLGQSPDAFAAMLASLESELK